ncbi:MAG TPA: gamma-glutamylcyclotransferase family protein [Pyrinomonadaceae bacterium]
MRPKYLFVYGTLLPDNPAPEIAGLVRQLKYIGSATIKGRLYDLGEYPGAIIDPSSATLIHGEIYELPDDKATLTKLDKFEEFDPFSPKKSLFVRTKCLARLADGSNIECWIYVYNHDIRSAQLIPNGNYAELKAS